MNWKMFKKFFILLLLVGTLSSAGITADGFTPLAKLSESEISHLRLITEAYTKMQKGYYTEVVFPAFVRFFYRVEVLAAQIIKGTSGNTAEDLDTLVYGTLEWMVRELRDPSDVHSKFIHKRFLKRVVKENLVSRFNSIGIEVELKEGVFLIRKVYEDSSAEEEGVLVGDKVIEVNGHDISGFKLKELEDLLKVENGDTIEMALVHAGQTQIYRVVLTARIIVVPTVNYEYYKDEKIAYIKVAEFRDETAAEVKNELLWMLEAGAKDIILDLSNNDGGKLDQAIALADLFLKGRKLVCYFLKREIGRQDQWAGNEDLDLGAVDNVLILVNGGSGSSSEIVAGSLRHYNGYVLFGKKTKGMGSLKNTIGLSDGSALYLVTSQTFLPDGTTFDVKGLDPDIEVSDETTVVSQAINFLLAERNK